jgi:thioredoxin reductase (NADPH)
MSDNSETFDVVIIGGGPAGISAGMWCAELGMKSMVTEREREFGGQLLSIHGPITNYLGLHSRNGREMHDRFIQQFEKGDTRVRLKTIVEDLDIMNCRIKTSDGSEFTYRKLIIATGVRRRTLGIPGENEFHDKGLLESGTKSKELTKGRTVVIVGGGDAALENATILSNHAKQIFVVHRRDSFSAREDFQLDVLKRKNITCLMNSSVLAIDGDKTVEGVEIIGSDNIQQRLKADLVLIRIGVEPNSELFTPFLNHDPRGYLQVDANCLTSEKDILAIGDVANPVSPTIATAAGMGATAAKFILKSSDL